MNELIFGEGCIEGLSQLLSEFPDPILVVCGARSFELSGARPRIEVQLAGRTWDRHFVRTRLPGFGPAREAISKWRGDKPGVILAVGGGGVIDIAKLTALAFNNDQTPLDSSAGFDAAIDVVAIPTTAGSGSERTPFAVAYQGTTKFSIAHESLRPVYAMVDPTLTYSLSADLTASSGLDAIAHAMESAWAAAATKESIEISISALGQGWSNLQEVVERPSPDSRREMAEASTVAGAAIAIAKTTACHALSYHLTSAYGVAHGVAVAITLGPMLAFNAGVDESNVSGGRSPEEIRAVIARVCDAIGADGPAAALTAIESKLRSLHVPTSLADLGIATPDQIAAFIESVNRERLANNPRFVSPGDLGEILGWVA